MTLTVLYRLRNCDVMSNLLTPREWLLYLLKLSLLTGFRVLFQKKSKKHGAHTPIILATWEAEAGG